MLELDCVHSNIRLRVVDVFASRLDAWSTRIVDDRRHRTPRASSSSVVASFGYRYAIPIPINTTDDVDVE